jgi:hypothetical protein
MQLRGDDEDEEEYFHVIDKILISRPISMQATISIRAMMSRKFTVSSHSISSLTPSI